MPELPEVETIRRGLCEYVVGKAGKILKVKVFERKSFLGDEKTILGLQVREIDRRGKALIIHLTNNKSIIIHLRMTGQLIWRGKNASGDIISESGLDDDFSEEENFTDKKIFEGEIFAGGHPSENFVAELPNKQTRVMIEFENGKLFFNDQRKFGFLKVVDTEDVEKDSFIKKLAKEPWAMEDGEFVEKLKRHKAAPIKAVILDQTVIAGLGNIYADEALFYAGIHPKRKAGSLTEAEAKKLLEGARVVMERSLEAGGSTLRNYVKSDGARGDYLELFAEVFNRQGKECKRCGAEIQKIKVGGRGTHFCPECQKIEPEENDEDEMKILESEKEGRFEIGEERGDCGD